MSKRTSIYLTDADERALEEIGATALQAFRTGLAVMRTEALSAAVLQDPEVLEAVVAARTGKPEGKWCTHPKARRSKGLCMACGTHVGD